MENIIIHNSFIIRKYRNGDFDGISLLWTRTHLGNPQRGDDQNTIDESIRIGGCMLVMEESSSGRIIGTSWMTYDGRRIHLHHFGIDPEFQRKGLSKLLLKESLMCVKKKGCQVKLEVNRDNRKAIQLYKNAGFTYLGDYDVYIIRNIDNIQQIS